MVFICKQKDLQFFIHPYSNILRSSASYSRQGYQFSPAQKFWMFPFFITHAEYIVGRSYAYVYCSIHYKTQSFFR